MSPRDFRRRIRKSLANETLQLALDANAERRVKARIAAAATLPDWGERRRRAHAVRAEVIDRLDEYLEKFVQRAVGNGLIVHRAKDAGEAIKTILAISAGSLHGQSQASAHQTESFVPLHGPGGKQVLVAKSKSMVTEEIDLNRALEAEGFRVVETDLGEYIVQLRRERPAHIITPAVHLRRQDVGQTFHEELGIPYTEDIPSLTEAARRVLRNVFLTADIGISGVNFGIAETGSICIVSNEGNARMVSSLPRVHIALMGMERLLRNQDDLALMLSVLARSATGQKLSAYTQLICRPLEGQERHIILLDNGRTDLRNSALRESLLCIRCGACLNACPVFREIGGHGYNSIYPGPIGAVISSGFFGSDFVPLAQASSLCGACKEACPVDIDLPRLLVSVRAGQAPVHSSKSPLTPGGLSWAGTLFLRIYSRIARSPRLFAVSQRLAALGTRLVAPLGDWVRLPAITGWGYSKDLPRFAARPFRARYQSAPSGDGPIPMKNGMKAEEPPPKTMPPPDLVEQFVIELNAVSGNCIRLRPSDVETAIVSFLETRGIERIHLEPNILHETVLTDSGIQFSHASDPELIVGVTRALCGLADTGSIVVVNGEGDPLHASLLPRIHLAILKRSDILPSLGDALRVDSLLDARAAAIITGPSRTGDIEMSHTIGVHGPAEVHVLLVDD